MERKRISLKRSLAPPENGLDEGKHTVGGATTGNPGEMLAAWAKRVVTARERRVCQTSVGLLQTGGQALTMTHRTLLWIIQKRDQEDTAWQTVHRTKCDIKRAPGPFSWPWAAYLAFICSFSSCLDFPTCCIKQTFPFSSFSLWHPLWPRISMEKPVRNVLLYLDSSPETALSICCPRNYSLLEIGSRTQFFKHFLFMCVLHDHRTIKLI